MLSLRGGDLSEQELHTAGEKADEETDEAGAAGDLSEQELHTAGEKADEETDEEWTEGEIRG